MDIFEIHRRIVEDYAIYIRSFVSISDEDLRQRVAQHLNDDIFGRNRRSHSPRRLRLPAKSKEWSAQVAGERNKHLVEAHECFSRFFRAGRFEVVFPVLSMDILGLYVFLPDS